MKKPILIFTIFGSLLFSLVTADAQYYYGANSYTNTNYNNSYYMNTGYDYYGGIGSYTIGCTTYYYSTRTHQQLYTEYICNNYNNNYNYGYSYTYPSYNYSYTYPYYYNTNYYNNYCTYRYSNGGWHYACGW